MHSILIVCVFFQIIAFDELRTDFKSPIDQCNPVHAVSNGASGGQGVSPHVPGFAKDGGRVKVQNILSWSCLYSLLIVAPGSPC